jgi:uncharacterized Fe-S cluster-containing radical SAM superfamily protein
MASSQAPSAGLVSKGAVSRNLRALKMMLNGRVPGQVIVQYTDHCNAACAQCGMRVSNKFERSTITMDEARRMIDAMSEKGVTALSFTGGEPLLYFDEIMELVQYAHGKGIPLTRTGTNGFIFRGSDKPDFMDKMKRYADGLYDSGIRTFWVSIDSADAEVHEKNRGLSGVIKGIEKGLPVFHERGIYPSANLGINRLTGGPEMIPSPVLGDVASGEEFQYAFREAFGSFYEFVEGLGFTIVNACYPMSCEAEEGDPENVYAAASSDDFISFRDDEKALLFEALYDTIPKYRGRLRIFSPRSSLLALIREYKGTPGFTSRACRGGIDFFFVDAKNKHTYPCGYRGDDDMGPFESLDLDAVDADAECTKCDWECFRDPSEMLGPVTDLMTNPLALPKNLIGDPQMAKVWFEDVRYYMACDFFNCRLAPNYAKLKNFARV